MTRGLPTEDLGRIGLAVSPANPDVVYATVEAANDAQGMFRSTDVGESWEKRSNYVAQGMYYGEIFADPKDADRVYLVDVYNQVSDDGGKTFRQLGEANKHVDNHVIWIDPADTDHLIVGCDGGVYESHDRGASWEYKANLPVTQFYRVEVDDSSPGLLHLRRHAGQQQRSAGPSRTLTRNGAMNSDWFVTWGGDGFHSPRRAGQPQHRLRHAAVRRARPLRPQERRGDAHPAAGGQGRAAAAVELGQPAADQPALARRGSTSRPTACSAATTAGARGSPSARTSPASSIAIR